MIDWSLIARLEGERLTGYVPNPEGSKSGVTIADGVDLSAWNAGSLAGLPPNLLSRFAPYFGLRGSDALEALAARPLTISMDEADALNAHVRARSVSTLTARYDAASAVPFAGLPDQAQTIIASVAFQYGDLASRCPAFWRTAVCQDWPGMCAELMNFGDDYPTRRHQEAAYMASLCQ